MKSTTIDLGYIGLSISIMCAKYEANVTGVDINEDAVKSLNNRILHLEEPFLDEALKEVIEAGTFKASLKPEKADCFIIAVPTPNNCDQYKICDISYIMSASENVIPYVEKGNLDDIRESPAMDIYNMLQKEFNIDVVAHDPHVKKSFVEEDIGKVEEDSSLILVSSDHNEVKDLNNVAQLMKDNIILDMKNIVINHGNYQYFSMGNLYQIKEL